MIQPASYSSGRRARRATLPRRRGLRDVSVAALVSLVLLAPAFAQPAARQSIADVRQSASWTPAAAVARVRAVVTLRDERRGLLFVQDETGGMFVTLMTPAPALARGDLLDLAGTAVMTVRGPTLGNATVTSAGKAPVPAARPLSALDGRLRSADARVVAAEGVVRAIRTSGRDVEVTIRTIEGSLIVLEPAGVAAEPPPVDAVVRVDGVLSHMMSEDRLLQRRELIAVGPVGVVSAPPSDPYKVVETSVADLRRLPPGRELMRRARVSGIVTRQRTGRTLHLRTATQPIRIESDQRTAVQPGDRVEAVGFPELDGFTPFLADAVYRRVQSGPPPVALASTLGELMDGRRDAELVTAEGTLLESDRGRDDLTLVIQQDGVLFNADLPLDLAPQLPFGLQPGAHVQLTGICSVIVDSEGTPRSFRLQLRDGRDVTIMAGGSLLTPGARVPWWAWAGLVLTVAAAGAGVAYRTGRVKEETIRRQLARESALKARFDDLFERSSEILTIHDRRGRVSTLNRAGEQAVGYSREELRMLDPSWVFGTDYLDAINRMIEEGPESTPRAFRSELVPRKGARIPIDVNARVLVGDGRVIGVTSISRDLSERDRLENELRQAQKMEAVGRLATGIAHDFNNLITVLLGYSDELIEQMPAGSDWQRSATEIRRAAERASGLTQQLLAFSRRQAAVAHTIDLNLIVANMEDLIRRLLGPEIGLEFSLDPHLAHVRADGAQIGQVIMNLIVNARDAMPKGGTLSIETANVVLGTEHLDVIPGPHVSLCVRDTGVGMPAEVRDRLFEPFFTTKDSGQGTGLGLSMVQGIVRQSGGHVVVESEPGKGSAFKIYFPPIADEPDLPLMPALTTPSAAVRGEGVVLLAEDDRSVRRLVVTELKRRGFTVLDAEDGRAALEVFQQHKDTIDILVTDVVMPRMNGADLAKEAGRIRPGLKILFISGHPERAGSGLDPAHVHNLLMKPFTADTLASRIKAMITGQPEMSGWDV